MPRTSHATEQSATVERFESLVEQWKTATALLSSTTAMVSHPGYRAIIALGAPVVPLLLRDLEREPVHWFEALQAITGEDPVPREHWGNSAAMSADWLAWGRQRGLICGGRELPCPTSSRAYKRPCRGKPGPHWLTLTLPPGRRRSTPGSRNAGESKTAADVMLTATRLPIAILLVTLVFAVAPARGQAAKPGPEIVMVAEAKDPIVRNSEASMVELKDGRLFMVWQEFEKGGGDSDFFPGHLAAMTSRDGGRTWNAHRVLVQNEPGDTNVFSPSLLRLPDGAILFCFMRYHSLAKARNISPPASAFAWVSRDECKTFTPLATLWAEKPITLCNSTLRRLSSGRIVLPINRERSMKGQPDHYEAGTIFSDDGGRTWTECANWVDAPRRGAMEPHVEELRDGRVLMVMRTQLGAVYRSESADDGKTWSKAVSLGVEAPESCPELIKIPSTSDLLLIWNASKYNPKNYSHFGKRTPLSAAVSRDDGKTWSRPRHLETDPGWAYSNPGCCFTSKGTAVINYWACKYQSSGAMSNYPLHLKAAIVDINWLYGKGR
jgi:sialidase-1